MSGAATLRLGTHVRVFLRSLFLQAAWNPQGMQNLGLAYALYPGLEKLYPDPLAR
ncbi:MAG: PTS system mannose/fructose/sorbose family transporter subunit IID, partial [Myxococcaceae bacterium]